MTRQRLVACAAAAICAAGAGWLAVGGGDPSAGNGSAQPAHSGAATLATRQSPQKLPPLAGLARASTVTDSFLSPDASQPVRQTFEAMLLEATDGQDVRDPAWLKKRLAALVPRYFPAPLAERATALLERYVDYRVALGELKPPADPSDPRALRAALDARQSTRQRYFTGEEYEALFAEEARLDSYTLARIEIERNSALSAAQKQAALKDNERELGDAQRAQRDQATAHMTVAAQTAALQATGASEMERFTQRRAQYGDAAATQLAQLDREERDWQARLTDYASAQAGKASPEQLQQLSQQLFSAQEQLRIEAALAARQQPATPQR